MAERERFIRGRMSDCEQLFEAIGKGAVGQVEKLLARGVSTDCRDDKERTPLIVACEAGNAALAGVILRHGADANAANNDGETALMKAALDGNLTLAKMLVEHGADVEMQDNQASNAFEMAQVSGHYDFFDYLLEESGDLTSDVGEEISTDPDDDGPSTDSLGGGSLPVAAAMIPSSEPQSYVHELDLDLMPEVENSPYFKPQHGLETAGKEELDEAIEEQEEQDNSGALDGESYAGAAKQKPTVSQMVAKVKTFLVTYVIMGLEAIGDYLLENVFDGNYKKALSKDPYKGTSLSDIADHKDMPLSRQRLGECIRVAAQTQELKSFGLEPGRSEELTLLCSAKLTLSPRNQL